MANIETSIICIRDFMDGVTKFRAGVEYFYFRNTTGYERIFYNVFNMRKELMTCITYDYFKDNFIHKSELEQINKTFNTYMDVY